MSGHRDAVRDAILDAVARVVHHAGVASVSMSQLAPAAGISRATLYKYFPNLEAVLAAWHHRMIGEHLASLEAAAQGHHDAATGLAAVLRAFALLRAGRPMDQIAVELHQEPHLATTATAVHALFLRVLDDAQQVGAVTSRVPVAELAVYCEHALSAAADLPSPNAVDRLVDLVISSLAPTPAEARHT